MSENAIKYIENGILGEGYYSISHKSGLQIYVYPKEEYASTYAVFGTKYGSIDTRFKRSDREDFTEIPAGTAHFLEHKLFESEELDAFQRYAKTGASANAYTSFDRTCYLFTCTGYFKENFEILLDFVRHPYFTEETVQKEQGIIGQEIDMYKDSPEWECLFNLLGAMYNNHPVKIDIAGTKESISQITAEMLFSCYDTFYNLSNMALAVAGKTTVEEVLEVADRLLEKDEDVTVNRAFEKEDEGIAASYVEAHLPVATPVFVFGYKENFFNGNDCTLEEEVGMALLLEVLAGQMSPLYKELLEAGLINDTFSTEFFNGHDYAAVLLSGESNNPQLVSEKIKERVKELRSAEVSPEQFEIVRKKYYGKIVRAFSDIDTVANSLVLSHFLDEELFSEFEVVKNIKVEFVNELLKKCFNEEKSVLSVIKE
ncbi:MAG: insulinase family protein [Oscillospiraceae bacterium]|nr:insulinase family protein [Oscillospiraceae bacterium]